MRRWARLLPLLLAAACSGLEEGEGGGVAIELEAPEFQTIEVGEQVQLVARALDVDGQVVDAAIEWQASSTAVSVDGAGVVTGVQPGEADVQAAVGSLPSEALTFTVQARADTIIIAGDSVLTLPLADPTVTALLSVRLESFDPAQPVEGHPVIFEITSSAPGAQLAGGFQSDTLTTAADGTAGAVVSAASGQAPPDTAIVEVRAEGLRGAVPGSGQRFIVLFQ